MARLWQYKSWLLVSISTLFTSSFFINLDTDALAQSITLDGSLGTPGTLTGPNYVIPQAAGQAVGNNLFHSFGKFNLNSNEAAIFQSNLNIQNILSRVTGGTQSLIDGLIRTQTGVNLFLINPSGIIFGKNASLNVGGSFVASTANAIQFGNLGLFSATEKNIPSPLLTINPSALFFNQINQNAAIQNNSIAPAGFNTFGLRVPDGKSLLLVGGNISMDGGWLNAYGGRVELGGLAEQGTVGLNVDGNNLSLSFPDGVVRADVSLTNAARVNVRAGDGGNIKVYARNLNLLTGSSLRAGIGFFLGAADGTSQAGDIDVDATELVKIQDGSFISNAVLNFGIGDGGNINIKAGSFTLADQAFVVTSTFGYGSAGNITLQASGKVAFTNGSYIASSGVGLGNAGDVKISTLGDVIFDAQNSLPPNITGIFSEVEPDSVGNAGRVSISANSLYLLNGAEITSKNVGLQGNAGDVTIEVSQIASFDGNNSGVFSNLGTNNSLGQAANINISIKEGSFLMTNGAQLATSTFGKGNAGNITINAYKDVTLDGNNTAIFTTVEKDGVGNGGNVGIKAESIFLTNGAQVTAASNGLGDAGSVIVEAQKQVSLDGNNTFIFTTLEEDGVGKGGNVDLKAESIFLTNGAQLATDTNGLGDAGNVIIEAQKLVSLDGNHTAVLTIVEPKGTGNGGSMDVKTRVLSLTNGAQLAASSFGQGNAGNIVVDAHDKITFAGVSNDGFYSGAFSTLETGGVGQGGDININTKGLLLLNNGVITANSSGEGKAGDIQVEASSITLNQGAIASVTLSGDGGNITLYPTNILLLRYGSQISTTAGFAQAGGNGGNITINTPNGFIVAVPNENSDISANAFTGTGGKVTINATGIYGITPRSREELVRLLGTTEPKDLDPAKLPTSDITAISQTNPILNGDVILNTPDLDPSRGLNQLPTNLVDVSQQIVQRCTPRGKTRSHFISTGRGGLPLNPEEPLRGRAVITNWVTLGEGNQQTREIKEEITKQPTPETIVEAQGWVINADGKVELVAYVPRDGDGGAIQSNSSCSMVTK